MRTVRWLSASLVGFCLVGFTLLSLAADKIDLDKVPEKIMSAVKARFPKAELKSVEKELEDGKVVFDVELKVNGRKYEMDILEDGTVAEIEKEVDIKDFPAAGVKAIEAKYPKATIKEIMEVNPVKDKKETPDHYEVTLALADGKSKEVIVSLDGAKVSEEAAVTPAPVK